MINEVSGSFILFIAILGTPLTPKLDKLFIRILYSKDSVLFSLSTICLKDISSAVMFATSGSSMISSSFELQEKSKDVNKIRKKFLVFTC